jgi:hypothetical protein
MVFESLTEALNVYRSGQVVSRLACLFNESRRELSLGGELGAYLGASSAHYANRFLTTLEDSPPMTSFGRSDVTIANTILSQLGGQRFLAMTGVTARARVCSLLPSPFELRYERNQPCTDRSDSGGPVRHDSHAGSRP